MTLIQNRYQELVSLTQLYLLREHSKHDRFLTTPSHYSFFQKTSSLKVSSKKNNLRTQEYPVSFSPISGDPLPNPSPVQPSPDPQIPSHPPITPTPEPRPDPIPAPHQPDPLPPTNPPAQPSPDPAPPVIMQANKKKMLHLEPLLTNPAHLDSTVGQSIQELFPHLHWIARIPDDRLARKKREAWIEDQSIPPVVILSFNEQPDQLIFLKNVARAISLRLAKAKVIQAQEFEKQKQWNTLLEMTNLKLVIASDYGIYLQPGLKNYYKEMPQQGKHFLKETPLLMLSDISLYLKQPQLKSLLWRAICNEFASF